MTKDEFLSELSRLRKSHAEAGLNEGCVESKECVGCIDCVFCVGCKLCYRSRYSTGCVQSSLLTHCERCRQSYSLAYCQDCENCGDSNYLVSCAYCFECDYCFGCIGLVRKDFHILNKKYSRSEYFKEVAALRESLGMHPPAA